MTEMARPVEGPMEPNTESRDKMKALVLNEYNRFDYQDMETPIMGSADDACSATFSL